MGLLKTLFAAKAGRSLLSRFGGSRSGRRRGGTGSMASRLLRNFTGGGRRRRV